MKDYKSKILKIFIPIMLSNVISQIQMLIDRIFLGRMDVLYMSAVGNATAPVWTTLSFVFSLSMGASILISQKVGSREVEEGKVYTGKVVKVEDFGCFVELWPGCEGMVHVSQLANERVNKPSDLVKVGDEIVVKSLGYDNRGRLNLSRKEALFGSEKKKSSKEEVKENKEEKTEKKSRKGLFRKGE